MPLSRPKQIPHLRPTTLELMELGGAPRRHRHTRSDDAPLIGRSPESRRPIDTGLLRSFVRMLDSGNFADALATLPECVLAEFGTSRSAVLDFAFRLGRDALERAQARAAGEALAAVRLPALVFDEFGEVIAANRLIEALTGYVHWRLRDCVSLRDRAADLQLRDAIAAVGADTLVETRAFPARAAEADGVMVVHVIPTRLSAGNTLAGRAAILALTPATPAHAPPSDLVHRLFGLTPAEARVACALAAGKTIEQIAVEGGTSQATIRTHVHRALEKTGCSRQAEIVALLAGIASAQLIGADRTASEPSSSLLSKARPRTAAPAQVTGRG